MAEVKETLEKQLQLLFERSSATEEGHELADLTRAMCELAHAIAGLNPQGA